MKHFRTLMALLGAAALLAAGPVLAHAELTQSNPKAGAVLRASPKKITLTFSERLVPAFSKLVVTRPAHKMNVPVDFVVSPDRKHLVGTPKKPLTRGDYAINWTAATSDGHKETGTVKFKVG